VDKNIITFLGVESYISGEMESQPSVELVVQAIFSLYHSPDMQQKEQASRYRVIQSIYAIKRA
jgi:hypothetical protein